jgi:predicted XRE-type DNA-binding protein
MSTSDDFEIVRGSGNAFADLGLPNAEIEQFRTLLAAKIIGVLDERQLSVREAEAATGVAASEFSRIRRVKLDRFTIDRLLLILSKLGQDFALDLRTRPRTESAKPAPAHHAGA